uniref:Uncharacterized protein n=1 Tax=Anguilla anguilla TaxID=7936 RepID=A0A0E9T0G6_ANGAN
MNLYLHSLLTFWDKGAHAKLLIYNQALSRERWSGRSALNPPEGLIRNHWVSADFALFHVSTHKVYLFSFP